LILTGIDFNEQHFDEEKMYRENIISKYKYRGKKKVDITPKLNLIKTSPNPL
jgi:hypothetical protein